MSKHFADLSSIRFLSHILRRGERTLVVCGCKTEVKAWPRIAWLTGVRKCRIQLICQRHVIKSDGVHHSVGRRRE